MEDYAIAQTLISILPILMSFGLVSAVPKFFFQEKDPRVGRVHASTVARWTVVIVALSLLMSCSINFIADLHIGSLRAWDLFRVLIAGAGSAIATIPSIFLRAAQRAYAAASFQLFQLVTLTTSGFILVSHYSRGLRGAVEAMGVAYGLDGVVAIIFIALVMRGPLSSERLRQSLRFSLPFIPHYLATWLQGASDRWTMKFAGDGAELGPYALAIQLSAPSNMAVSAWNDADSAQMGERVRAFNLSAVARTLPRTQLAYLAVAASSSMLVVVGTPLLAWLVGKDFVSGLTYLPWIGLAIVLEALYYPNANVVYFSGHTRLIPLVTICSAITMTLLSIILIPRFGVRGAVTARCIAAAVRSVAMWWAARVCLRRVAQFT